MLVCFMIDSQNERKLSFMHASTFLKGLVPYDHLDM